MITIKQFNNKFLLQIDGEELEFETMSDLEHTLSQVLKIKSQYGDPKKYKDKWKE